MLLEQFAPLAQLAEHRTFNPQVLGSSPRGRTVGEKPALPPEQAVYSFTANLWVYPSKAAWYFVTLPNDIADEIKDIPLPRRGFGSLKVSVDVGVSTWETSIFPDSKSGSYLLPIKKAIRAKNGLHEGDSVAVTMTLHEE